MRENFFKYCTRDTKYLNEKLKNGEKNKRHRDFKLWGACENYPIFKVDTPLRANVGGGVMGAS